MIIGSHVSCSGKNMLLDSVIEAISYGGNALMIYTGAPQNTKRKNMEEFMLDSALTLMNDNHIELENVIVHAPYIINLANTTKKETFELAVEFLTEEIKRCEYLGVKTLVLHPGSHVDAGEQIGLDRIIEGLNLVLKSDMKINIALETMSGKGSECAYNFDQIKYIIDGVKYSDKLVVCMDTCHLHDSGYDLSDFDKILDEFNDKIGLDKLAVIHLNDSKNVLGAKKDRHENIGFGEIGFDKLMAIVYNERLSHIPFILETPYIENPKTTKKEYAPYKYEIAMIKDKKFIANLKDVIVNESV